jgi:hypothetical protein
VPFTRNRTAVGNVIPDVKVAIVVALVGSALVTGCGRSDAARAKDACGTAAAKLTVGPQLVLLSDEIKRHEWTDRAGQRHRPRDGFVVLCRFTAREAAPSGFAPIYVVDHSGALLGEAQGSRH